MKVYGVNCNSGTVHASAQPIADYPGERTFPCDACGERFPLRMLAMTDIHKKLGVCPECALKDDAEMDERRKAHALYMRERRARERMDAFGGDAR